MGFTIVNGVFYATQANNWNWGANGPFQGLAGIAYSTDQGQHWVSAKQPFPGPTGNVPLAVGRGLGHGRSPERAVLVRLDLRRPADPDLE